MQTEKLNAIKGAITDGKLVRAAGGITQRTEQSDKIGFDWRIFTVNDVDVRKVTSSRQIRSARAPTIPSNTRKACRSINNAFYRVDGVIKVYMDGWVDWEG